MRTKSQMHKIIVKLSRCMPTGYWGSWLSQSWGDVLCRLLLEEVHLCSLHKEGKGTPDVFWAFFCKVRLVRSHYVWMHACCYLSHFHTYKTVESIDQTVGVKIWKCSFSVYYQQVVSHVAKTDPVCSPSEENVVWAYLWLDTKKICNVDQFCKKPSCRKRSC